MNAVPHPLPAGTDANARLRHTLREQDAILENAGVGIAFIKQRQVVRCNQRYAEIYGFPSPQSMEGTSSLLIYPDEQAFKRLGVEAYRCWPPASPTRPSG